MNIIRDKERVNQTGEVFTPTLLVNEILDKLPQNVFADSTKTFCDPACGDGQFLVEVLKHKLCSGSSAKAAADSIYGVDYMEDNIDSCKDRLRKILAEQCKKEGKAIGSTIYDIINRNIIWSDAFDWDFENWCKTPEAIEKTKTLMYKIKQRESDTSLIDNSDNW